MQSVSYTHLDVYKRQTQWRSALTRLEISQESTMRWKQCRHSLKSIDWTKVIFKGLFIKGIYGREMFETWYKMAALIQSGLDLSPIITCLLYTSRLM